VKKQALIIEELTKKFVIQQDLIEELRKDNIKMNKEIGKIKENSLDEDKF
jgi:hypothetical protein